MSGPLFDCYVIAPERTAEFASKFLDEFLPERVASFDEDDPSEVLRLPQGVTIPNVFCFLEENSNREYWMCWHHARDVEPYNAIVAFNADGSLILGLSPCGEGDEHIARQYLRRMEKFAKTGNGLLSLENPPPSSREEFYKCSKYGKMPHNL